MLTILSENREQDQSNIHLFLFVLVFFHLFMIVFKKAYYMNKVQKFCSFYFSFSFSFLLLFLTADAAREFDDFPLCLDFVAPYVNRFDNDIPPGEPGSTSAYIFSSGGSFGSSSPLSQNQADADFDAETDLLIVEFLSSDSRTIDSGDEESLANKKTKTAKVEREGCFSTIFCFFYVYYLFFPFPFFCFMFFQRAFQLVIICLQLFLFLF
jgi:hypothetical protein